MNDFDAYYDLVNLIDKIAADGREATAEEMQTIENLAKKGEIEVVDFADANDCGYQNSWDGVIEAFAEMIKSGERVAV